METTRRRAAIYARISQDREGAGIKVEDQEKDCRQLARRLGLEVVEVFTDNDLSAHRGKKKRPGYGGLLAAVRAGQVDAVLCTHADRLLRSVKEMEGYIDTCQDRDVPTYQVMAGQLDLATASGKRNARLAAVIAEGEVDQMIERMRAARLHRVTEGKWTGGRRPFGYEADGVTVNQAEAEALRWAASQVLAGVSLNATVAKLNKRGVRTATGKEWQPTELRRVLVRPRNAGLTVHRGEIVGRAEWPAILDEDTRRGVSAVLGDPTRRTNTTTARQWLLSGLARCGVCGDFVRSTSPGSSHGRQTKPGYTCRSGKHVVRDAAELDAYMENVILERLSRPAAAELLAPDQRGDTSALHLRDAALRARLDELGRLCGEGLIDASQLVQGTAAIRTQREEITAQLAAASRGSVLAGVADAPDPAKVWAGLDLSRKRAIVDVLMTVTILPAHKGRRAGWRAGETYFDPASVRTEPKR
jgi:DNA invertase Pin-like site-specific DNA recombinase